MSYALLAKDALDIISTVQTDLFRTLPISALELTDIEISGFLRVEHQMKRFRPTIFPQFLLLPFFLAEPAHADGPFGIDMGVDARTVTSCDPSSSGSPSFFQCTTLPKPHSAFEMYSLMSPKQTGVCRISAAGVDIRDGGYGVSTRNKVDEIAEQVKLTYGPWTKKFDFLMPGSIWDDPDDWLMGIAKEDRLYSYAWESVTPTAKNNVEDIVVTAKATRSDTGYVYVEINFLNSKECMKAARAAEADAF